MEARIGQIKKDHDIILKSREKLTISGVQEIINFDENNVNVRSICGELCIDGENIHINVLNVEKGDLEISGKINGINYFDVDERERKTLLSKIFNK